MKCKYYNNINGLCQDETPSAKMLISKTKLCVGQWLVGNFVGAQWVGYGSSVYSEESPRFVCRGHDGEIVQGISPHYRFHEVKAWIRESDRYIRDHIDEFDLTPWMDDELGKYDKTFENKYADIKGRSS